LAKKKISFVKIHGDSDDYGIAKSEYDKQIVLSPSMLRKRLSSKSTFVIKRYILVFIFWHRSFIFNSNKSLTWWNNFSVYYPDVCLQLNMFRATSRLSWGAQWLRWQPLILHSYRGDNRAVFVVGPAVESVDNKCWCLKNAIFYAFITRLTVEERIYLFSKVI
jgi:hypothetical protein